MMGEQKYPHSTLRKATAEELLKHTLIFTCPWCKAETAVLDGRFILGCQECGKTTWRGHVEGWEILEQRTYVKPDGSTPVPRVTLQDEE
jgi:transcription elongation factor Elf1